MLRGTAGGISGGGDAAAESDLPPVAVEARFCGTCWASAARRALRGGTASCAREKAREGPGIVACRIPEEVADDTVVDVSERRRFLDVIDTVSSGILL